MCGIFCAISTRHPFPWERFGEFAALTDLVRYRGPDDSGYLALNRRTGTPSLQGPFDVFLGNRRLAILDLSPAGHMPMADGKGRWLTYNGEIFNFVELRKELEAAGRRFKTDTDTEVILQVYDVYGEKGFEKLNGMWAFALVDLPARRVVLSRDRFSIKPLFQYRSRDALYFASEIKQLLPVLESRDVDLQTMSAYLWQGLLDHSPNTFYRGIQRVAPKSNVVVSLDTGAASEQKYWDYSPGGRVREQFLLEEFRELFLDSVRIRLRSDVKLGALLSGGVDSSTIVVAANQVLEQPLESFSVVSENSKYSEESFVDLLCRENRILNRKLLFQSHHPLADLDTVLYHSDEPFTGFSVVAQYKILQMIRRETDLVVLLSGQGGDEVLLGYKKFLFFYLRMLAGKRKYARAASEFLHSFWKGTIVRQFRLSEAGRYIYKQSRSRNGHFVRLDSHPAPIWMCRDMRSRQMEDLDLYSVPALTHYEDRNSMAHSLEVRHPFLDHRLVDFCLNLPTEWKIRRGWTKFVLREGFPEVAAGIRWRKDKQGFITPEELWVRQELCEHIRGAFQRSTLGDMGFIDDRKFLAYYEDFRAGRGLASFWDVVRTFIAEAWAKRMFGAGVRAT
jgi:asparagine synthase (glutamine-hydrolysing)